MLDAIRSSLTQHGVGDVRVTERSGDEAVLAQSALRDGATAIVALGGDGTWSRVAAAVIEANSGVPLAFLAAGTGNDFAESLGAPVRDVERTLALVRDGRTRQIDAGTVDNAIFVNSVGFGFDAFVLQHLRRVPVLPRKAVYLASAAVELARYDGLRVSIDDGAPERVLEVIGANAPNFGGGFHIAPGAAVDDGQLDLVCIDDGAWLTRARLLGAARRGTHLGHRLVRTNRAASFQLVFDEPPWYQRDGELVHASSRELVVGVLPRALTVVTE